MMRPEEKKYLGKWELGLTKFLWLRVMTTMFLFMVSVLEIEGYQFSSFDGYNHEIYTRKQLQ